MKRRLIAGGALAAAAAALVAHAGIGSRLAASPAQAQYGGTPVNVNAAGCILFGNGHRILPAGSTVVIRSGWASGNRGAVLSFLAAQTTILSVNDAPMIDVSGGYGDVVPNPLGAATFLSYPTNVTLWEPGDSMRFTFALILNRPLVDVVDVDGDGSIDPGPATAGLSYGGTCTVTAV